MVSNQLSAVRVVENVRFVLRESFQVECPTGSGNYCTLRSVADEIERR